jgi:hypothetical protein
MYSNAAARILVGAGKVGVEKGVVQPRSRTMRDLKYGPASRLSQTVIPVLSRSNMSAQANSRAGSVDFQDVSDHHGRLLSRM